MTSARDVISQHSMSWIGREENDASRGGEQNLSAKKRSG
jgi:hypothetical protein